MDDYVKPSLVDKPFRDELMSEPSKENFGINSLERFLYICNNLLNKHTPQKEKIIRRNHYPFINKDMFRAITTGTK